MSITNRCTFMAGGLDINMVYRERIYPAELCQQIRALSVLTAVSAVGCQRRLPCWWGWEGSAGGGCGSEEGWCLPKQKKRRVEGKEHMHLALKSQQLMQFSFLQWQKQKHITMCRSSPKRMVALTASWSSLLVTTSTIPCGDRDGMF